MEKSKKITISIITGVLLLVVLVIGAAYAYFSVVDSISFGTKKAKMTSPTMGNVSLISGDSLSLNLTRASMGMKREGDYYASSDGIPTRLYEEAAIGKVHVTGEGVYECEYTLSIVPSSTTSDTNLYTAYSGMSGKANGQIVLTVGNTTYDFNTTNFSQNQTVTGKIPRIEAGHDKTIKASLKVTNTDDDQNVLQNKNIKFTFSATTFECYPLEEEETYKEELLNGAYPVYSGNLIPVTIDNDGTTKKADITKEWYSYEDKVWANAVLLNESATYENGATIPTSNIKGYFVWVPKYKYKLFDMGNYNGQISGKPTGPSNARTIEIEFGTTNTTDTGTSCATPMTSGGSGNCAVGKWMTHPAFISMNSNGLWVGKYEATGDISSPTVLPNQTSVRNQTVKSMFESGYNFSRTNDSHMMKNTEWGAVAYLSHSKHGINDEIRINNNSDYKTGYVALDNTDQSSYPGTIGNTSSGLHALYNTESGYKGSTTGNISGIYDMSGGAHEYMASYMSETYLNSGFDATSIGQYNSKYFDVYNTGSWNNYTRRILGDATGEMGPFYLYNEKNNYRYYHNNWYADYSEFMYSSFSWLGRGAYAGDGVLSGQFSFFSNTGISVVYIGFRLVLTN